MLGNYIESTTLKPGLLLYDVYHKGVVSSEALVVTQTAGTGESISGVPPYSQTISLLEYLEFFGNYRIILIF